MSQVDRIEGLVGSIALKAPCRVATTANITMSGFQTINGVTLADGDDNLRVFVRAQTNSVDNGVWVASSGSWTRDADFDGARDVVQGTLIYVYGGTTYAKSVWQLDTASPVIGTSALTFSLANDVDIANALAASSGSSLIGHIASGTGAIATTVQSKLRESVSVKDFGAVGDGVTDDTNALLAFRAASIGKAGILPPGTYLTSGISLVSNIDWSAHGEVKLKQMTSGNDLLSGVTISNVRLTGITFEGTNDGTSGTGVVFQNSSHCVISGCDFSKFPRNGVKAVGTSGGLSEHIKVENCYFYDWADPGAATDSSAVAFMEGTRYCTAKNNKMMEYSWQGILLQDILGTQNSQGYKSAGHQIVGNVINAKRAYGITLYENRATINITSVANNGSGLIRIIAGEAHNLSTGMEVRVQNVVGTTEANRTWIVSVINSTTIDLHGSTYINAYISGGTLEDIDQVWHLVDGNTIYDIDGEKLSGVTGAGIYVVGCGNVRVVNNYVRNTNISTTTESLAPAAIGINNSVGEVVVANNVIERPNWYGILITSCISGKTTVTGNSVRYAQKTSIYVNESAGVVVSSNVITPKNGVSTAKGIRVTSVAGLSGAVIANNVVETYTSRAIDVNNVSNYSITGNTLKNLTPNVTSIEGLIISNCSNGTVVGNSITVSPSTQNALYVSGCTDTRVSANTFIGGGGGSMCATLTGTCTNTLIDETNFFSTAATYNNSTGGRMHTTGSSAPVNAARQIGDTNWNTAPTSAGYIGWTVTTAGDPPTWKTFGLIS